MCKILQTENIIKIKYYLELDPDLKISDNLVCFAFLALNAYTSLKNLLMNSELLDNFSH